MVSPVRSSANWRIYVIDASHLSNQNLINGRESCHVKEAEDTPDSFMRITLLKNRLLVAALISGLLFAGKESCLRAQARPPVPEEDTQVWNDVQASVALSKEVDFNLFGALRFGRDVTHLVDRRAGAGFNFKLGQYLTLAPWYLNIVTRPAEGRKASENRLNLAATVRLPLGKYALVDRNLFERRLRSTGNSTRYRNRLQLERPFKLGGTQLGWFLSDEVFYDWSVDDWVRNRFTAGLSRRFNKHFTGELYYMRQNDGRSRPGDLNVIGLTYRFRL